MERRHAEVVAPVLSVGFWAAWEPQYAGTAQARPFRELLHAVFEPQLRPGQQPLPIMAGRQ